MKKAIATLILAKLAGLGMLGHVGPIPARFALVTVAFADTPPPPPADTTQMAPAEVTKWLGFFDKLVSTVVNTQTACDKMAVDVNAVMDSNKDAIAIAKNAKAQGKKLPDDAKAKMVDGVKKMLPGMQNCGQNPKVRAAFGKLDLTHR